MHWPPIALVIALVLATRNQEGSAQEPAKRTDLPADDAIWGYGGIGGPYPAHGRKPAAAPIVPSDWVVVPAAECDGRAELIARAFDPAGRAPTAGAALRHTSERKWEARSGQPVENAACAFTRVTSDRDEVRMARLSGASLLVVNGAGFVGDPERRGDLGVPVALHAGANELYVFDIRGRFELELWAAPTRTVLGTWDVRWPSAFVIFSDDLSFPVFNASLAPVTGLHVHYGHGQTEGGATTPSLSDWRDGGRMLPLGLRMGGTYFIGMSEADPPVEDRPAVAPVCVYASDDEDADRQLLRWPGKDGRAANDARHGNRREENLRGTLLARVGLHPLLIWGAATTLDRARFDQELIWYRAYYVPEAVQDKELASLPPETQPDTINWHVRQGVNARRYLLYGNAETNEAWARFVPDDAPIQVHEGHLVVNGTHFASHDICGWFILKTPEREELVVLADTGAHGARLGYLLQPLLSDAAELDYCFWDSRGEGGTPRIIASGRFAEQKRDTSGR